jgi:hypothetical protein
MLTGSLASAWRRYPALGVLGVFVLLAVVHTWPLASDPAGLLHLLQVLAIAAIMSAVVLFPFLCPYYQVQRLYGFVRSLQDVTMYRATWNDYLASYRDFAERLADFPSAHALDTLRTAGVTHIIVHHDRFGPMPDHVDGLTLIATGRHISLYRLDGSAITATRSSAARAGPAPR